MLAPRSQFLILIAANSHPDCRAIAANQTNCGTAACAMGHAALDPWFQSLGLKLEVQWNDPESKQCRTSPVRTGADFVTAKTLAKDWVSTQPTYLGMTCCAAAAAFFGITERPPSTCSPTSSTSSATSTQRSSPRRRHRAQRRDHRSQRTPKEPSTPGSADSSRRNQLEYKTGIFPTSG